MTEHKNTQTTGMEFMEIVFILCGFVRAFIISLAGKFTVVFGLPEFQAQHVRRAFSPRYSVLSVAADIKHKSA